MAFCTNNHVTAWNDFLRSLLAQEEMPEALSTALLRYRPMFVTSGEQSGFLYHVLFRLQPYGGGSAKECLCYRAALTVAARFGLKDSERHQTDAVIRLVKNTLNERAKLPGQDSLGQLTVNRETVAGDIERWYLAFSRDGERQQRLIDLLDVFALANLVGCTVKELLESGDAFMSASSKYDDTPEKLLQIMSLEEALGRIREFTGYVGEVARQAA